MQPKRRLYMMMRDTYEMVLTQNRFSSIPRSAGGTFVATEATEENPNREDPVYGTLPAQRMIDLTPMKFKGVDGRSYSRESFLWGGFEDWE